MEPIKKLAFNRRDFLKLSALAGAYFMVPKTLRAFGTENFTLSIEEVQTGQRLSGQSVTLFDQFGAPLGSGQTIDGVADFIITDVKDEQRITGANVQHDNIAHTVSYHLPQSARVEAKMYDVLGQKFVGTLTNGEQGAGMHTLPYSLNGISSGVYFIDLRTENYNAAIAFTFDGRHVSPKPVKVSYTKQIKQEPGRLLKPTTEEMYAIISDPTNHYTRIVRGIPSDARSVDDRFTGYVQQEGVDPALYKEFVRTVNTSMGGNTLAYEGFKTFFPNVKNGEEATWWLATHGDTQHTIGTAEQEYFKGLLESDLHAYIPSSMRPGFYFEDPANPETLPMWQQNVLLVVPSIQNSVAVDDFGSDGSLDSAGIKILHYGYNNSNKSSILQETLSALVAPNQCNNDLYNHFSELTVLSGNGINAPTLTNMDTKLLAMGQYYTGKEQLEDLLGL